MSYEPVNDEERDEQRKQELYNDACRAFESINAPIVSRELCCQAMSWLHVFGCYDADCVFGTIRYLLLYAQERLSIKGTYVPATEDILLIQKYNEEADRCSKGEIEMPLWLETLCKRYNLKATASLVQRNRAEYLAKKGSK